MELTAWNLYRKLHNAYGQLFLDKMNQQTDPPLRIFIARTTELEAFKILKRIEIELKNENKVVNISKVKEKIDFYERNLFEINQLIKSTPSELITPCILCKRKIKEKQIELLEWVLGEKTNS